MLYNDNTYGLQIISVNPVAAVTLGKNDPSQNVSGEIGSLERAQNSYNRAITTLNEKAEEYQETTDGSILSTDTRCVGSNPLNKNYPDNLIGDEKTTEMFTSTEKYMSNYNGKYFKTDMHYKTDYNRLEKIGATTFSDIQYGKYFWLASRNSELNPIVKLYAFCICSVFSSGTTSMAMLFSPNKDGYVNFSGPSSGLRPVFTLSPNVKIIDGEGTEEVPFEIGL